MFDDFRNGGSLVSIIDSLTMKFFLNKSPNFTWFHGYTMHSLYSVSTISKYCTLLFEHRQTLPTCLFWRRGGAGSVVRLVLGHRIKGICCLLLWCLYSNCCGGLSYFITLCSAKYGANNRAASCKPSTGFTITKSHC